MTTALTGAEKAAVLILSLPPEVSRELLSRMEGDEIDQILSAVSRVDEVDPDVQSEILDEFRSQTEQLRKTVYGGPQRTLEVIERLLPDSQAQQLRAKFERERAQIAFALHSHSPQFIADTIAEEHPQTVALILSQIPARRGAEVIASLPEELRADVVLRLASLGAVSKETITEIAEVLEQLFSMRLRGPTTLGGVSAAAELIGQLRSSESDHILSHIEQRDEGTAAEIRDHLLTFDHLISADDRGFQKLLQQISTEDTVLALKTASEEMRDKIYKNVSSRAAEMLREEEELLGPRKLSEVEAKQREIVEIARRMAEEGELTIRSAEPDEVYV